MQKMGDLESKIFILDNGKKQLIQAMPSYVPDSTDQQHMWSTALGRLHVT